jgi:hypothetical protein
VFKKHSLFLLFHFHKTTITVLLGEPSPDLLIVIMRYSSSRALYYQIHIKCDTLYIGNPRLYLGLAITIYCFGDHFADGKVFSDKVLGLYSDISGGLRIIN